MESLAELVDNFSNTRTPMFYAHIVANNIMRTRFHVHALVWLGTKLLRLRGMKVSKEVVWATVFARLEEKSPGTMDEMVKELVKHIRSGQDLSDPTSAGGLNGEEVRTLLVIMIRFGWRFPLQRAAIWATTDGDNVLD